MYVCCKCGAPIKWWEAYASTPLFPYKCRICGSEQSATKHGVIAGFLVGMALLAACLPLVILSEDPRLSWISDILVILLLGCLIGVVVLGMRMGKLYPLDAGRKRRERWILASVVFLLIAIPIAFRMFH